MPLMAIKRLGWFRALVAAELLVAASATGGLWLLRSQVIRDELSTMNALSRAMALQADRTLGLAAAVLRDTRDELAHGLIVPDAPQASALLQARVRPLDTFRALSVFDTQGHRVATSRPEGAPVRPDIRQMDFFSEAQRQRDGRLYVSDTFTSAIDGQETAVVSTAWHDLQGRFRGVMLLAAPPDFLEGDFERIRPAADTQLHLHRTDGSLLRPLAGGAARDVVDVADVARLGRSAPAAPLVSARRLITNDQDRLVALAHLQQSPLLVVISRDTSAVLAGWRDLAWLIGAFMASTLAGTFAVGVKMAREQIAHEALAQRLARSRKLEALGQLAGGVAHDFNNTLAAVIGFGEMAREAAEPGSRQARQLDQVVQAGLRGRQQVARILAFSRGQARAQQPFALGTLVAEVLDHLDGARPAGVHVQRELQGPPVVVAGDPTALYEAVMNLCTNAIQAMGPTGVLRVAVRVAQNEAPRTLYDQELPAGRHACITVTDNGPGMTPDVLARLFEPFFTTKGRGGTGLGLAVVHGVVTDMGGAIDVRSAPGEGTVFALYLPLSTAAPVATPGLSQATLPSGEGQCVLVVDDEPTLVELGEELLASLGYEPVGTSDPQAALQAFTQDPGRFDLLLTDENMPGLSGTQLAQAVRAIRPDLPVLLVSGHGGPAFDARVQAAGIGQVLGKPLTRDELARALQRCLQRCTS